MIRARSLFFLALANQNRLRMLELLSREALTVGEIQRRLGLDQTTVSHSLKCLAFCGFVSYWRRGRNKIYYVDKQSVRDLLRIADEHVRKYAAQLYSCENLQR